MIIINKTGLIKVELDHIWHNCNGPNAFPLKFNSKCNKTKQWKINCFDCREEEAENVGKLTENLLFINFQKSSIEEAFTLVVPKKKISNKKNIKNQEHNDKQKDNINSNNNNCNKNSNNNDNNTNADVKHDFIDHNKIDNNDNNNKNNNNNIIDTTDNNTNVYYDVKNDDDDHNKKCNNDSEDDSSTLSQIFASELLEDLGHSEEEGINNNLIIIII
jgi:hypothetical protein